MSRWRCADCSEIMDNRVCTSPNTKCSNCGSYNADLTWLDLSIDECELLWYKQENKRLKKYINELLIQIWSQKEVSVLNEEILRGWDERI